MKCIFCRIIKGQEKSFEVWRNRDFLLLLVPKPINPGHVILIPKTHIDYVFDIKEPLYSKMFQIAKKISLILKKSISAKRIGLAIEGFGVSHIHIHLVPVNKGNELNPLRAKMVPERNLRSTQDKFIKQFKKLKK